MQNELQAFQQQVNHARFHAQAGGHYESFFLRANHPMRALAFWIRYTIFSPKGAPQDAVGELWAVFFDGETNRHAVAKQEYPLAACAFDASAFRVEVGTATLGPNRLEGAVESGGRSLAWNLAFEGDSAPILLLPFKLYQGGFPAAKSLVSLPLARFNGELSVNGEAMEVADWVGSQNHNWGSRHTDRYVWGQVAGFDNAPEAFLECATAQVRIGPFWSPRLTLLVLRDGGEEIALNGLLQAARAHGDYDFFRWTIDSRSPQARLHGRIEAPAAAFVGLNYLNPPGGSKTCLNSKLASAEFTLERPGRPAKTFVTRSRAAFEILTDRSDHGVRIAA